MTTQASTTQAPKQATQTALRAAIFVASLGYFVDVYDIALFGIVRVDSLKELGLNSQESLLTSGVYLLNMQMGGMLLGGLLWGVLGDKLGRVQVLFGSILLYSIANLLNAFVQDVPSYALLRLVAGIGLAGEIGAGITLVSEMMPKERRGLATMIVATVGVSGAIAAAVIGNIVYWRTAYIIGGIGGLSLLALRVGVYESGLFNSVKNNKDIARGDLKMLLTPERAWRYLSCIFLGVPMFFFITLIVTLAPELGRALGLQEEVSTANAMLCHSIGITTGDLASGVLSQALRSRKRSVAVFLACALVTISGILLGHGQSASYFYTLCLLAGFSIGYWCVLVTTAAEQFGTNLRATVASTVPNFVRGSTIPISLSFLALKPYLGTVGATQLVGVVCFSLAAIGLYSLRESFAVDLNFLELLRPANSIPEEETEEVRSVGNL